MALSQGNNALWSDIQSLYTTLSSVRTSHGLSAVSAPSTGGQGKTIYASTIHTLNNSVINARGETHLASSRNYTALSNPSAGTLLSADWITKLYNNVNGMTGISHCNCNCNCNCNCDSCGCSGFCEGFG